MTTPSPLTESIRSEITPWLARLAQNKGERAALRRAQHPADVYASELAHRLADRLALPERDRDTALHLAALLAQLRETSAPRLVQTLSRGGPDDCVLKRQRFAQLLRADKPTERLRLFRRALHLADNRADPIDLAYLFLTWEQDRTKRDFARGYFTPTADPDTDADSTPISA